MTRIALLFILVLFSRLALADDWMVRRQTAASFADTREAIVLAIENRGLVINFTSHIADMLDRTGADIGSGRKIFEQAEIVEFCSAGLSRKMMEADPHNIVLCPFAVSIYTLPGDRKGTWVAYRKPQGKSAALVEGLLKEIAAEAGN